MALTWRVAIQVTVLSRVGDKSYLYSKPKYKELQEPLRDENPSIATSADEHGLKIEALH